MLVWMIAAFVSYFVKGLCGFANTLVFTGILSFASNNINITPVDLLLGSPSNIIIALRERKTIRWRMCLPLCLLVILGCIPGAFLLKNTGATAIKITFGAIILLLGLEMLIREFSRKKAKQSRILLTLIGVLSGLLCGMYGVGALLGAYIGRVADDSHSFKGNLCVVFTVENIFRIILYSVTGIINIEILKQVALLFPFMLAGLGAGMFSCRFIPEKPAKRLVCIALMASGIVLILNNIL